MVRTKRQYDRIFAAIPCGCSERYDSRRISLPDRYRDRVTIAGRNSTRGQLYAILRNTVYVGDIVHNGAPFADFSH
jgi:hypothetical protein